ncbi:MAG: hypothetical protein MJZ13_05585 [Bacteroidales bacterium]|nr:hypothetical protein [Bacteroidales bacterium]
MKKLILSLAVVFASAFTACDPVEDFTENTAKNFTGDQIDATLVQNNGENLVQVTVHTDGTAQISNGKQTIKANYADLILREMGENTVYVTMLTADGNIVEKQYKVNVTSMPHELPVLETIVWQGEEIGGGWSGTLRFCVGQTNEGVLPYLPDETYDWMVGKKMSLDIKEASADATVRITTGWWSVNLCDDIPISGAPCKIQFEMTQEFADVCKTQHLLFTGNGSYTITKFYFEL